MYQANYSDAQIQELGYAQSNAFPQYMYFRLSMRSCGEPLTPETGVRDLWRVYTPTTGGWLVAWYQI